MHTLLLHNRYPVITTFLLEKFYVEKKIKFFGKLGKGYFLQFKTLMSMVKSG